MNAATMPDLHDVTPGYRPCVAPAVATVTG